MLPFYLEMYIDKNSLKSELRERAECEGLFFEETKFRKRKFVGTLMASDQDRISASPNKASFCGALFGYKCVNSHRV